MRNHVSDRLSEKERKRMVEIVRSSKGRPSNLSDRERRELRTLLAKVEPRELAKTIATSPFASRTGRAFAADRQRPPLSERPLAAVPMGSR